MKKWKFEYKWVIVAICTLMVFTCLGFGNSAKGMFVGPVSEALKVKRAVFSLSDTIRYLATAAANMFFGKMILRFGTKKLIIAGFVCVALASVLFSVAPNIYVFLTGSFFLGIGLAFTTTTMIGSVVNKWFTKGKGTIMGFALASSGIGGALATQVLTPIIYEKGYKNAYMLTAIIVILMGILAFVFFRENPKEEVSRIHHDEKAKKRSFEWTGIEYSEALKKPYFYGAVILVFLSGFALQGMSGSAAAHITDVGFDYVFTSSIVSISLIALAFSKFITGFIYDKFGLRTTVSVCSVAGIAVMFILAFMELSALGQNMAVAYALISSLALPMETVLIPLYASDLLGEKSFTKAMGVFAAVNTAGFALGAPVINSCYDIFGSYRKGFVLFGIIMIIVFVGFQFVITAAHKERKKQIDD